MKNPVPYPGSESEPVLTPRCNQLKKRPGLLEEDFATSLQEYTKNIPLFSSETCGS